MTKRKMLGMALAVGLGLVATADSATAQVPQPQTGAGARPAVSPYLNLNRPGNPAVNLYGLVKPQQDTTRQLQTLQQQQQQQILLPQLGAGGEEEVTVPNYAITGHSTMFANTSHYFGQSGIQSRPAVPPPAVYRRQ